MLILRQKSFQFHIPRLKNPQPVLPYLPFAFQLTQMLFRRKIVGRLCDGNSNLLDALKMDL